MLFYPLLHDYPIFLTIEDMPHLIRKQKLHQNKHRRSGANIWKFSGHFHLCLTDLIFFSGNLFFNPFFLKAMQGMSSYAKKKKYYITYAFSDNEKEEVNYIKDFITSNLIAGICLLRLRTDDKSIEYLKRADFPFVVIGRPENPESMLWVDNDNFKSTYNLMNTLIKKGHKDIAFLGAKEELTVTKDRLKGYKVACEMNGLTCADKNIIMKTILKYLHFQKRRIN